MKKINELLLNKEEQLLLQKYTEILKQDQRELSSDFLETIIKKFPHLIFLINNPSIDLKYTAVSYRKSLLQFIPIETFNRDYQKKLVKTSGGFCLQYVKDIKPYMYRWALDSSPLSIIFLSNIPKEIVREYVKTNPYTFLYLSHTPRVVKNALRLFPPTILLMKNLPVKTIIYYLNQITLPTLHKLMMDLSRFNYFPEITKENLWVSEKFKIACYKTNLKCMDHLSDKDFLYIHAHLNNGLMRTVIENNQRYKNIMVDKINDLLL